MSGVNPKPQWADYAAEVIPRLSEQGASPTTAVIALLGYAVENEGVGVEESERRMAKAWLARLIDEDGNPLDDEGRGVIERAVMENTISSQGSYTELYEDEFLDDKRVVFEFTITKSIRHRIGREGLEKTLVDHFARQAETIAKAIYEEISV